MCSRCDMKAGALTDLYCFLGVYELCQVGHELRLLTGDHHGIMAVFHCPLIAKGQKIMWIVNTCWDTKWPIVPEAQAAPRYKAILTSLRLLRAGCSLREWLRTYCSSGLSFPAQWLLEMLILEDFLPPEGKHQASNSYNALKSLILTTDPPSSFCCLKGK